MKSVLYLVKNNIRFKTGAFRSVIILMAIIVFSYSCSVSNSKNLNRSLNQSLDHYNVGDLVMTFKGSEIPTKVIDGLDENENVSSYRTDDTFHIRIYDRQSETAVQSHCKESSCDKLTVWQTEGDIRNAKDGGAPAVFAAMILLKTREDLWTSGRAKN